VHTQRRSTNGNPEIAIPLVSRLEFHSFLPTPTILYTTDDMTSPHQRPLFRPSVSSRLSIAISTRSAEAGEAQHEDGEQIDEEIEEIRRYEVTLLALPLSKLRCCANLLIGLTRTLQR